MKFTQKAIDAFALPSGRDDIVVFDDDIPSIRRRRRRGSFMHAPGSGMTSPVSGLIVWPMLPTHSTQPLSFT